MAAVNIASRCPYIAYSNYFRLAGSVTKTAPSPRGYLSLPMWVRVRPGAVFSYTFTVGRETKEYDSTDVLRPIGRG